ncbi:hypothetical protein C8Q79DRAFT_898304 [Trametes meyenii]|nr:hypothetical protein C8Q79DRAFT_898304 [Trametes meyenii]
MSGRLLPHALLEFTLARASARLESLTAHSIRQNTAVVLGRRFAHQQVAFQDFPAPEYVPLETTDDRSMYASRKSRSVLASGRLFPYTQDGPLTELEQRIMELKEDPVQEGDEAKVPAYSESELLSMYEELLAVPSRTETQDLSVVDPESQHQADEQALRGIVQSLYALEGPTDASLESQPLYTAAIAKLSEIVNALESARSGSDAPPLEVSILLPQEWLSLVRICVHNSDGRAAESVIDLMKRSNTPIAEESLDTTLALYADKGDLANAERFLAAFVDQSPSERQRDLHIKAHLKSVVPGTFPTSALAALHEYEGRGLPAPQRAYTRVINTLLHVRSVIAATQAWDLFAHMRYVAHPTPDPFLYTVMISACASRSLPPEPARALDLWTEMTIDKGIPPSAAAYSAIIFACARSGEKPYVAEAFRLAKEMMDGHRDAYGSPAFRPDRKAFSALLEGAKRTGDLAKVRWILAEIISESLDATRGDLPDPVSVDEGIMTHVFHAYAAYQPPFNRAATVVVDQSASAASSSDPSKTGDPTGDAKQTEGQSDSAPHPQAPLAPRIPQFTNLLPQSNSEVLGEARALFYRILKDVAPSALLSDALFSEQLDSNMPQAFENVRLSARLLNAYLSVHYAHGMFDQGSKLYHSLFTTLGVEKNAWTYVEALERCARARKGLERKPALRFAQEIWEEWQPVEDAWRRRMSHPDGMDARMVERAYTAKIRVLAMSGRLREAVQLVRAFVERYPPDVVKQVQPKPALRSGRIMLQAPRPLVRMYSAVEVPDDTVPPLLSFPEVELLHHRLVDAGDEASIRYLKWVCMAYAGALKGRKHATLRAEPVALDSEVQKRIEHP